MEVTFSNGYGSNARTIKVKHGYQCVTFSIECDNGEDTVKVELPTDQLLAIVKCYRTLEQNNR